MWAGTVEAEAVASLKKIASVVYPQFQLALEDDASFLSFVSIDGIHPATRREATREKFELAAQTWSK